MYIYPLYVRSKIYPDRPDRLDVTAITVPAVGCMRGTAVANTWIEKFPEQNDLYMSNGIAEPGAGGHYAPTRHPYRTTQGLRSASLRPMPGNKSPVTAPLTVHYAKGMDTP